jgi:hypothetical protein
MNNLSSGISRLESRLEELKTLERERVVMLTRPKMGIREKFNGCREDWDTIRYLDGEFWADFLVAYDALIARKKQEIREAVQEVRESSNQVLQGFNEAGN